MGELGGLLQNLTLSKDPNRYAYTLQGANGQQATVAASPLNNLYSNLTISGNNLWTNTTTACATWPQAPAPLALAPAARPRERTNLDWLDERINEMRVKL